MDIEYVAANLIIKHGPGAPKIAVDIINRAIREHDLASAYEWETVAIAVDEFLSSARSGAEGVIEI